MFNCRILSPTMSSMNEFQISTYKVQASEIFVGFDPPIPPNYCPKRSAGHANKLWTGNAHMPTKSQMDGCVVFIIKSGPFIYVAGK